jgi:hypothetical protein
MIVLPNHFLHNSKAATDVDQRARPRHCAMIFIWKASNPPKPPSKVSYSLNNTEIDSVMEWLNSSRLGQWRSQIKRADGLERLIRCPLVAAERDTLQRDIAVQLSDDVTISPFGTPKPKHFQPVHPYEHRYVTQLSISQEAPPKHFQLGYRVISDARLTTKEARVGKDGPAYFCPTVAYFGGDIDTVLVRPHLRLVPLHKTIEELAKMQGYEVRPSDKGIYADETIGKWGGLSEVSSFLQDGSNRKLFDHFLDKSASKEGKGVYLADDQRRYLEWGQVRRRNCVG